MSPIRSRLPLLLPPLHGLPHHAPPCLSWAQGGPPGHTVPHSVSFPSFLFPVKYPVLAPLASAWLPPPPAWLDTAPSSGQESRVQLKVRIILQSLRDWKMLMQG